MSFRRHRRREGRSRRHRRDPAAAEQFRRRRPARQHSRRRSSAWTRTPSAAPSCWPPRASTSAPAATSSSGWRSRRRARSSCRAKRHLYKEARRLVATRKPIVAAVHGSAIGAGLGLAVVADFRVTCKEARFAANFTAIGFHPGLRHDDHAAAPGRAAEGALADADRQAHHRRGSLRDRAGRPARRRRTRCARSRIEMAREIAKAAPLSVQATRETLNADLVAAFRAATERESFEQNWLRETNDYKEGVRGLDRAARSGLHRHVSTALQPSAKERSMAELTDVRLLIGGEWQRRRRARDVLDKFRLVPYARMHIASHEQVRKAVAGAQAAYDALVADGVRPRRDPRPRGRHDRVAQRAVRRAASAPKPGFTLSDSQGELRRCIQTFRCRPRRRGGWSAR